MFGHSRTGEWLSWRWLVLLAALAAGVMVLAACGESATPTPEPTATPAPTPTSEPTPTSTPTPTAAPTPTPALTSLSDIDETTTGADLIAVLSESEVDCLRTAVGDEGYQAMQGMTLAQSLTGIDVFPLQCLEPANAIDLSAGMMSLQAGGLSDDSLACVKGVFAEHGMLGAAMNETDAMRLVITMRLCLTDEEAMAMDASGGGDPFPPPSQLRCISEQTDLENLFIVYQALVTLDTGMDEPTPEPEMLSAVAEIMAAQEACGIPIVVEN